MSGCIHSYNLRARPKRKRNRRKPDWYTPGVPDNKMYGTKICQQGAIKLIKKGGGDYRLSAYAGKTCVNNGMKNRKNQKYNKLGILNIKELYRTNDEELAYEIERELIKYLKKNKYFTCLNKGLYKGSKAKCGPYIVYIAYQ